MNSVLKAVQLEKNKNSCLKTDLQELTPYVIKARIKKLSSILERVDTDNDEFTQVTTTIVPLLFV